MDGTVVVHLDNPDAPATLKRSGSMDEAHSDAVRHYQVHSDTLRSALERSASILIQPSQEPQILSITSTVFKSPNGPVGPKRPKSPKSPNSYTAGCSPSIPVSQSPIFP